MRACPDGYPSCRQAEATGKWCAGECAAMSAPRAEPDHEEKEKAEANPAGHGEALPDESQPIDSVIECAAIGLESAGFDGLYIPGICGCKLSELSPCACINSECTPGYLHEHSTDKTRWVVANQKKPMTDKEIEGFLDE